MTWRNRIVGHGMIAVQDVIDNPDNWRTHPYEQWAALEQVLDEVGWVSGVKVNKVTGVLVDGHLRVARARERGVAEIPVTYLSLTKNEQDKILSLLDPTSELAINDVEQFRALRAQITGDTGPVKALLSKMTGDLAAAQEVVSDETEKAQPVTVSTKVTIALGNVGRVAIPRDAYLAWREDLYQTFGFATADIVKGIAQRVGIIDDED